MLEQFIKSTVAYLVSIEPMNAYIQKMPKDVKYPAYVVNKCDINTTFLNSVYYVNTVTLYIRVFGNDEVGLKNKVYNLINSIFENRCIIPILDVTGLPTERYIRVEDVESIDINVDQNEIYCQEINFSFDTQHPVNIQEFDILAKVNSNLNYN